MGQGSQSYLTEQVLNAPVCYQQGKMTTEGNPVRHEMCRLRWPVFLELFLRKERRGLAWVGRGSGCPCPVAGHSLRPSRPALVRSCLRSGIHASAGQRRRLSGHGHPDRNIERGFDSRRVGSGGGDTRRPDAGLTRIRPAEQDCHGGCFCVKEIPARTPGSVQHKPWLCVERYKQKRPRRAFLRERKPGKDTGQRSTQTLALCRTPQAKTARRAFWREKSSYSRIPVKPPST